MFKREAEEVRKSLYEKSSDNRRIKKIFHETSQLLYNHFHIFKEAALKSTQKYNEEV